MQGFQNILPRGERKVLTTFFPKNAKLSLIYETDKTTGGRRSILLERRGEARVPFTPIRRHSKSAKMYAIEITKLFENMAHWAHSSVSTTFGLKLHLVLCILKVCEIFPKARAAIIAFNLPPLF
jgi:hypothetical protein